ncbi:MAG: tyrosine-type recombinase/integrase [Planctomycetota bacterium]|jgi:integrase
MSVFKPKYKDKRTGKSKSVSRWWVEVRDHQEIVRRFPAFTDKTQSKVVEAKIKQLVACKQNGVSPETEPTLVDWLNGIPEKLQEKLTQVGLLDGSRAATNKPLSELIAEFVQFLSAKERTKKHIVDSRNILDRIFADCGFRFWSDISASKVMACLKSLRNDGMSYKRSNGYLGSLKSFCNWMIEYAGIAESPLRHLKPLNAKLDRRRVRRALTVDELRRLLEATKNGPERFGMNGYERFLVYKLAVETGLRSKEVRRLTVSSFDFVNRTVAIEAVDAKGKREDVLSLRKDTAAMLKQFFRGKMPGVRAFGGTYGKLTKCTGEMVEADLASTEVRNATGKVVKKAVPYIDDVGRYADFHSLRHTTGTLLAASGVHPKVAQAIMRHRDINLTMSLYTHTLKGQESDAVNGLPDLSAPSRQTMRKTGTDDLGSGLQSPDGNARTPVDTSGQSGTSARSCAKL